jgi:hypothetical protein
MKQNLFLLWLLPCILYCSQVFCQTPISNKLLSQNYYLPNHPLYNALDQSLNGTLNTLHWGDVRNSDAKYIRIGGKSYDKDRMFHYPLLRDIIDEIRDPAKGNAEPIIQIPIQDNLVFPCSPEAVLTEIC